MADKTPGEIQAGDASRGSKVHATQADDSLSHAHNEEAISRLQSAVNDHNGANSYIVGDLVRENNQVYICKVNNTGAFGLGNWRIVNNSNLFAESSLTPVQLDGHEILMYPRSAQDGIPESILPKTISRSQSAAQVYDDTDQYAVGDLVLFDNLTYRNITAVTGLGETFDIDKWIPVGGVGAKNVKHIFTASDFPTPVAISGFGTVIPLENGFEYIIAAPLTISNAFFIEAGFEVLLRAFSTETNTIDVDTAIVMFQSRSGVGTFTAVADGGGGSLVISTTDTSELTVGKPVNILSLTGTDYTQVRANVSAITANTNFTIDSSITFDMTSTGDFDVKAKLLEIERLTMANEANNVNGFDMHFTPIGNSEFFMFHCEMEGFNQPGLIDGAKVCVFTLNELEELTTAFEFMDCVYAYIAENVWIDTNAGGSALVSILGGATESVIISNNSFLSSSGGTALNIFGLGVNSIGTGRIIVEANVDRRVAADTLFDDGTDDIDETDNRLIVKNNIRQSDSSTAFRVDLGALQNVNITVTSLLTEVDSTSWVLDANSQRFSLDTGPVTGEITYDGLEDADVLITYQVILAPTSTTIDLIAALFINGSPGLSLTEFQTRAFADGAVTLSGFSFIKLVTGDTIQLGVANGTDTTNIDVISANVSAVRSG